MIETISGLATSLLVILVTQLLAKHFTAKLIAATILVAIPFIYVGFSLQSNAPFWIFIDVLVAVGFYFLALVGYSSRKSLLAYGLLMHGLWDILHHRGMVIQADVPGYWPTFCFIVDLIDGIYFLLLFRKKEYLSEPVISRSTAH